ncbi:MAG TPA: HD domain-containing protein [Spirochaetota bacterium]|nr:HD domain-containing protein [Spirochaetota bacterium]HPI89722.1 HD domain-containing protein [Spirochaetota bacterium]HPR46645.1 HD domain-containing protein [Spirochaetota bacterium]
MALIKKVDINLDYLTPNRSFIYPLWSESGEKVLEARVLLTKEKIQDIRKKFGNMLHYRDTGKGQPIPAFRLKIAYKQSKEILNEVERTQKFSKTSFRDTEKVIEEIVNDLNSNEFEFIQLLKDLKSHDDYLYTHAVNVGVLTAVFSKLLGNFTPEEIKYFTLGAFLLDIGEMKIDRQLLNKEGKFNISDMQKMKRHPQLGYEMLKEISGIHPIVLQTLLFHHEKYNNRGYYNMPYENLPIPPKLVSICDVYDALTTARPFREAISPARTLKILFNLSGNQFDFGLVHGFINKMGPMLNNTQSFYARNDILALNTEELAMVKDFGIVDSLRPKVIVFCKFERHNNRLSVRFYDRPIEIDLQQDGTRSIAKFINNDGQVNAIMSKLHERQFLTESH